MAIPTVQTDHALGLPPQTREVSAMRGSIRHRWSLLADADVRDLKTLDNLVEVINTAYRFGVNRAAGQVQEWAAGQVLLRADVERGKAPPIPILPHTKLAPAASWGWREFGQWH